MQTLVSTKYQVVIPKSVRKKISVKPGQKLNVHVVGTQIVLSKTEVPHALSWPEDHLQKLKNPWQGTDGTKWLDKERNTWD